jgi:hypothetical protein
LNGSIDESEAEKSYLGSDLHRKIVRIKNEHGARGFDVKRYEGEPTMNPRPVVNTELDQVPEPAPKALFPLYSNANPLVRPEADHPIHDNSSYAASDHPIPVTEKKLFIPLRNTSHKLQLNTYEIERNSDTTSEFKSDFS